MTVHCWRGAAVPKSSPSVPNYDLLADDVARANVRVLYDAIFFALDSAELRQVFDPIDDRANKAKANSRRWGLVAVALGAYSLLSASAQPLLHVIHVDALIERAITLSSAFTGVLSVLIGLFGVLYAGSKREWMRNRYMTERLRQFHFQSMVALLPEMISDPKEFAAQRHAHFQQFKHSHIECAKDKLEALLEDDLKEEGWLFAHRPAGDIKGDNPNYRLFVSAYMQLRVNAQIDFCAAKLARRGLFSSAPRDQLALFGALAGLSVLGALTLHVASAAGTLTAIPWLNSPFVHVLGLWCFVSAMTIRTLEEGYRPQREVERYRQYRAVLISVRDRLSGAVEPIDTIAAMKQLERTSYEEMVNFLKAYAEARFVM